MCRRKKIDFFLLLSCSQNEKDYNFKRQWHRRRVNSVGAMENLLLKCVLKSWSNVCVLTLSVSQHISFCRPLIKFTSISLSLKNVEIETYFLLLLSGSHFDRAHFFQFVVIFVKWKTCNEFSIVETPKWRERSGRNFRGYNKHVSFFCVTHSSNGDVLFTVGSSSEIGKIDWAKETPQNWQWNIFPTHSHEKCQHMPWFHFHSIGISMQKKKFWEKQWQ